MEVTQQLRDSVAIVGSLSIRLGQETIGDLRSARKAREQIQSSTVIPETL